MKLSDLTSKTKNVSFDFDGEPVKMEVRSRLVTPKLVADLDALQNNDPKTVATRMHSISEHLARLVVSWDVLDNDGSVFPLDVERLAAEIPIEFQTHCLVAVIQAMKPGEASAPAA